MKKQIKNSQQSTIDNQQSIVSSRQSVIPMAIGMSVVCCLLSAFSFSQNREVPFTLEDRDRIMQTQKEVSSLRNEMNTRFESQQKEVSSLRSEMNTRFESQQQQMNDLKESIRDLKNLFYWGFGILFTFMLFIFGYIVWDRKTVTEPIRERTQSLMQTLREYSKKQPELADILRSHGLL